MRILSAAVLSSAIALVAAGSPLWGEIQPLPISQHSRARSDALKYFNSLAKRQTSNTPSNLDLERWNVETTAACSRAIGALNGQASNPSGMAVCYNVPFLDPKTGVFQAELRMFNISAPVDEWAGVPSSGISLSLRYVAATVEDTPTVGSSGRRKRDTEDDDHDLSLDRENFSILESRQTTSDSVKVLTYVAILKPQFRDTTLQFAELQPLVIPEITLIAISPVTQARVDAALSPTEAGFVSGLFSDLDVTNAQPLTPAAASALAANAKPFVLPGVTLGIFPTGLIITLVWTAIFVGGVGFGTIGRVQFREQYRRRLKTQLGATVKRI